MTSLSDTRNKLLDAEIIVSPSRGELRFALPYMADYLRDPPDAYQVW